MRIVEAFGVLQTDSTRRCVEEGVSDEWQSDIAKFIARDEGIIHSVIKFENGIFLRWEQIGKSFVRPKHADQTIRINKSPRRRIPGQTVAGSRFLFHAVTAVFHHDRYFEALRSFLPSEVSSVLFFQDRRHFHRLYG